MARPGLTNHRKFLRLVALLKTPEATVLGCLEFMWQSAYENGDDLIGDSHDVEIVARWPGDRGVFVAGAKTAGFIDKRGRKFYVHDLFENAPDYVSKRAEREQERKKRGKTLSDLRREAAVKRWSKRESSDATGMQVDATENHLQTARMQVDANGGTPAPRANTISGAGAPEPPARADQPEHNPDSKEDEGEFGIARNGAGQKKHEYPPGFENFWSAYPRKIGKGAAFRAWKTAIKRADPQTLVVAAAEFAGCGKVVGAIGRGEERFIPHPSTWLNQGRWEDDRSTWVEHSGTTGVFDAMNEYLEGCGDGE